MSKILHLTNTFIPEDSRILKAIGTGRETGYDVVGIGINTPEKQHQIDESACIGIISVTVLAKKLRLRPRLVLKFFEVVEFFVRLSVLGIKQRPQIIHCHDLPVLPAAILIKYFTSAKLIYDAHELSSERNGLSKIEKKLIYMTEVIFWPLINFLIIVSPSIQEWYGKNHKPKSSEVILNSPQINVAKSAKIKGQYFQNKFAIPKNHKVFIYLGHLCEGRGLEILINAFKLGGVKTHLVIIGYGPIKDDLFIQSKGSQNIHFHDAVDHGDVVPLSQAADYGFCMIEPISLSDQYCLPNKLFEYAFSGLPVIASGLPDIKDIVTKYELGICIPNDAKRISKLLIDIENMDVDVTTNSTDIFDLSYEAQAKKLTLIYKSLLC